MKMLKAMKKNANSPRKYEENEKKYILASVFDADQRKIPDSAVADNN